MKINPNLETNLTLVLLTKLFKLSENQEVAI